MNITHYFLIYLIIYRLSIIFTGLFAMILGYRLFIKGVGWEQGKNKGADVETSLGSHKFSLKNAAPGTCFALFGVIIITTMYVNGNPELTLKSMQNAATYTEKKNDLVAGLEIGLKGIVKDSIDIIYQNGKFFEHKKDTLKAIANYEKAISLIPSEPFNALAWLYLKTKKMNQAKSLSLMAVYLEPENANYLDTYAEILYAMKDYKNALNTMKKAAKLDVQYKEKIPQYEQALE